MSGLSLGLYFHRGANPRREHVLALRPLRRNLERRATRRRAQPSGSMAMSARDVARRLEELIAALDRRVPRAGHAGEAGIAQDAAALRAKAVDRLAQLTGDSN